MPVQPHRLLTQAWLPMSFVMFAGAAAAQTTTDPVQNLPAAQVEYKSTLSDFQPYTDQTIQSWSEANDRVGRIGGWRSYAKELATGEAVKDASDAPDPHSGHHGGGKQ